MSVTGEFHTIEKATIPGNRGLVDVALACRGVRHITKGERVQRLCYPVAD